jgi:hypothetical protein
MTNPEYHKIFKESNHFPKLIKLLWEYKLLPQIPKKSSPSEDAEKEFAAINQTVPVSFDENNKARYRATATAVKLFGKSCTDIGELSTKIVAFLKLTARMYFSERNSKHQDEQYVSDPD